MIQSVLKRRGFVSSSLVRLLDEFGTRSLRTEAPGVISNPFSWKGESVLSRIGFLRGFSGISDKQKTPSSSSSSDSSESDFEEKPPDLPPPPHPRVDTALFLRSLNAHQFQQHLKELRGDERPVTYEELLKAAKEAGAAATWAESRQLCETLFASGTIFRYGNRVYLDPSEITDSVRSVLPGAREETEALVKKLEKEIEPLEETRQTLDNKIRKANDGVLWFGLIGAVLTFLALYYSTFKVFSWDVVEPIAYFLALGIAIIYYFYFVVTKTNFEYSSVRTQVDKILRRRCRVVDVPKYEALKKQIETHNAFLKRFKR